MQTLLFFSRLAIFLLLALIPWFMSPAVAVAYDLRGGLAWFVLLPAEMFAAFFLRPPRVRYWVGPVVAIGLLIFFVLFFSDFARDAIVLFSVAAGIGFFSTRLVFSGRGAGLAALELFLLGYVYYKLLSFTRASADIAEASGIAVKVVLILAVLSFLMHAIVLYLAAFPDRARKKRRRELLVFGGFALPVLILLSIVLPNNFVAHEAVLNDLREEPPPTPRELGGDERGGALDEGGAPGESPDPNQNGLPLGRGEERYPSQRQNGDQQRDGQAERESRPDEHRGGGSGEEGEEQGQGGGQGNEQGQGGQSGREEGEGGQGGQSNQRNDQRLEGIPADQWDNRQSMSGQDGRQSAVMVIASRVDPVYAATGYLGEFRSGVGFVRSSEAQEPLNALASMRLLETWEDQVTTADDKRQPAPIYYLSTLEERALAYRPFQVQPTVEDTTYHPFDLSYNAVSRISVSTPEDWYLVREYTEREKERFASYLEVSLSETERAQLQAYLNRAFATYRTENLEGEVRDLRPFERIEALLLAYKDYQYEMGFSENTQVNDVVRFISETKTGDCTEFSHSAAMLGRMAGIPSRVVVGYLASRDLQTRAHRSGLYHLRQRIRPLQRFELEELYLVTTSHSHAWTQFFLPGFGWIDFEPTTYAIPPEPQFNPNNMDVLIPLIEERTIRPRQSAWVFPWRLALKVLGAGVALLLIGLYGYRFVRESYLRMVSRKTDPRGLRALLQLLLMKMARDGYDLKARHETALEYAQKHRELENFARQHTMLRFRSNYGEGERETAEQELREQFAGARKRLKRPGLFATLRRWVSLRGLYY